MIEKLVSFVTPSHCLACGQQGSILCDICKFNITDETFGACLLCGGISDAICLSCHKPWLAGGRALGWRTEVLEQLGNAAKFERSREAARALSGMLALALPHLPEGTIVTSVPTHPAHVRVRGYDFVDYFARTIAQQQNLPYHSLVERHLGTEQRGQNAKQRALQAVQTYEVKRTQLQPPLILLVDDVVTTGSTLSAIAQKLHAVYHSPIYLAAAMRQPKGSEML